ncbi:MAG: hypothetical protein PHP41_01620 [Bacilli bacterium]|jgi:hypothetical protein|nr:hypothetical protein [Bacilli bacterium]MDY0064330.1 hypothetical protein [Bacilli bacterium]
MGIDEFKLIGASLIVTGLLFFIANNAIQTTNYRRKSIYIVIFGLLSLLAAGAGIAVDLFYYQFVIYSILYFVFPLSILFFTIGFYVFYAAQAKKYKQRWNQYVIKDIKEERYLYVLFRYEDFYLLKKDKDNFLGGDVIRFAQKERFHDEKIKQFLASKKVTVQDSKLKGDVRILEKNRQTIFYCYEVSLTALDEYVSQYEQIDKFQIGQINTKEFHKNVILRMAIGEPFSIRLP